MILRSHNVVIQRKDAERNHRGSLLASLVAQTFEAKRPSRANDVNLDVKHNTPNINDILKLGTYWNAGCKGSILLDLDPCCLDTGCRLEQDLYHLSCICTIHHEGSREGTPRCSRNTDIRILGNASASSHFNQQSPWNDILNDINRSFVLALDMNQNCDDLRCIVCMNHLHYINATHKWCAVRTVMNMFSWISMTYACTSCQGIHVLFTLREQTQMILFHFPAPSVHGFANTQQPQVGISPANQMQKKKRTNPSLWKVCHSVVVQVVITFALSLDPFHLHLSLHRSHHEVHELLICYLQ